MDNKQSPNMFFNRRHFMRGTLALSATIGVAGMMPALAASTFTQWIREFQKTANQHNITPRTYQLAFGNVTAPDPEVLEKAAYQPEFRDPTWNYFDNRVNDDAIAKGQEMARKWQSWLARIEKQYGVDRNILLAIWSMETGYGAAMERSDIMRDVFRSLATLAHGDRRRARFARNQLIAALQILQNGDIDRRFMTGSWAGAMGHTQFIPTSYQAFAVDVDGDGRRDIWRSIPDALASSANLLRKNGWQTGRTWGYEVVIPEGRKFPAGSVSIAEWERMGVRRANGSAFPNKGLNAELKLPDGREGPVFLALRNFFVLKRYNNADRYALAVGLLADRIGGFSGLVRDWNRPFTPLSFAQKQELQQQLKRQGLYQGDIDGKIGSGTRNAIKTFQSRANMAQDGYPSMEVLNRLRQM